MLPALVVERLPRVVGAIRRLATRPLEDDEDIVLADELAGVTAMVAEKFTNDRTAEGIQRAMYLTTGCVSLGLEDILATDSDDAALCCSARRCWPMRSACRDRKSVGRERVL